MHGKKLLFILLAAGALCSPSAAGLHAQLIEPTRGLAGASEAAGLLNVLSEPPGMEVRVDGRLIGKTPVFSASLPAGAHVLRVRDSEIEIRIAAGKTTAMSWFKGSFIEIPPKSPPAREKAGEPQKPAVETRPEQEPQPRPDGTKDPYYWPLNPRGPIY
jgi:hypothetical protein